MGTKRSKLNFGIISENSTLRSWELLSLSRLLEFEKLNFTLHIVEGERTDSTPENSPLYSMDIKNKLWDWHQRKLDNINQLYIDLQENINSTKKIQLQKLCTKEIADEIEGVVSDEVDFIIQYSQKQIPRSAADIAKHGIWSFFFNGIKSKFPLAYFWNVYKDTHEMQISLEAVSGSSPNKVLYNGVYRTKSGSLNDVADFLQDITNWPRRVARRILDGKPYYEQNSAAGSRRSSEQNPELPQMLAFFLKQGINFIDRIGRGEQFWNIGVSKKSVQDFMDGTSAPHVTWFNHTDRNGFIADPFPVEIDGQMYIFVEQFQYSEFQGKISYMTYPDGFRNGELRTAHEEPFHLSYPYVFKKDAKTYVTPETYEANEIRLYRIKSPDEWEFETVLIPNVEGLDPTLIQYEDRWWLFFTKNPYSNTTLYLWYSSNLTGGWKPHAENPVKTDIRSARPAGSLFSHQGNLYRPSQKCSKEYGEKITFNKIEQMTPEEYVERSASEYPAQHSDRYPNGRHTIAESQGLTVIDGKKYIKNRYFIAKRMNQVVSKLT